MQSFFNSQNMRTICNIRRPALVRSCPYSRSSLKLPWRKVNTAVALLQSPEIIPSHKIWERYVASSKDPFSKRNIWTSITSTDNIVQAMIDFHVSCSPLFWHPAYHLYLTIHPKPPRISVQDNNLLNFDHYLSVMLCIQLTSIMSNTLIMQDTVSFVSVNIGQMVYYPNHKRQDKEKRVNKVSSLSMKDRWNIDRPREAVMVWSIQQAS